MGKNTYSLKGVNPTMLEASYALTKLILQRPDLVFNLTYSLDNNGISGLRQLDNKGASPLSNDELKRLRDSLTYHIYDLRKLARKHHKQIRDEVKELKK